MRKQVSQGVFAFFKLMVLVIYQSIGGFYIGKRKIR